MPIRVIRDDTPERPLPGQSGTQKLDEIGERPSLPAVKSYDWSKLSGGAQTTWVTVNCSCTLTGRSYGLVFRQEDGKFVLMSTDPGAGTGEGSDASAVDGPFDWSAFECPECGLSKGKKEPNTPGPVIKCSCQSLFCVTKGLRPEMAKGKGEDASNGGWWWTCPKCGIEAPINVGGLKDVNGQKVKGK